VLGYLLVSLSLLFVIYSLYDSRHHIVTLDIFPQVLFFIVAAGMFLFHCAWLISYVFKMILEFISSKRIPTLEVLDLYLKANICKYLPGNVMQYVTRNIFAKKIGISQSEMAFASFLEIFFVVMFSFTLCILLSGELFLNLLREHVPTGLYAIIIVAIIAFLAIVFILLRRTKRFSTAIDGFLNQFMKLDKKQFFKLSVKVFFIVTYNQLLLGFGFFLLLREVSGLTDIAMFTVISAYIISWLIGFITPGAPGGIGVKEAILSLLLMDFYGREYVLISALLFRFVTILIDVLAFSFFMLIKHIKKIRSTYIQ